MNLHWDLLFSLWWDMLMCWLGVKGLCSTNEVSYYVFFCSVAHCLRNLKCHSFHVFLPGVKVSEVEQCFFALVSRGQTTFFRFYLWWRKKGSGLVHTRISSSHLEK